MESLNKRGIHPGLEGIRKLTEALGDPEADLKVIQVAGTNGKGSVSMFLSRILMAAGYKVGLYQSPAVFSEREIIRVNGREMTKEAYGRLTEQIANVNSAISATRFECETAMALLYFKEKECDLVILEAGLGGRDDATNLTRDNVLSVITSIGLDHMGILGNTVGEIAGNKAGVIKPDSFCVSAAQCKEAEAVLQSASGKVGTELSFVDKSGIKISRTGLKGTTFGYKGLKGLKTAMLGVNQPENAALAIEGIFALRKAGFNISDSAIAKGIGSAMLEGRFEIISDKPLTVIDGAHNEPAAECLSNNIETYFTNKELVYIMGMFKDKDSEAVARILAGKAKAVITVSSPNKVRTMSAFELAEVVGRVNPNVSTADSIEEAVELARLMAGRDGVIIAFGSFSILKEVKRVTAKLAGR